MITFVKLRPSNTQLSKKLYGTVDGFSVRLILHRSEMVAKVEGFGSYV